VQTAGSSGHNGFARAARYAVPLLLPGLGALFGAFLYFNGKAENSASPSGSVQAVGSESMRPSVTACAEDFMTRNHRADVIVKGGGSGDGIAALLHGIADIGMASRPLSQREREFAGSKGFEIGLFAVALDGVTIIVNRANPITALDLSQLRDIFVGTIRNWGELDAAEAEILPFARAAGSGTAFLFGERVLGDQPYAVSVMRLSTNEAIVAEVASRPAAIGYTDLGAFRHGGDRVKAVALRADSQSSLITATPQSISSGHYPLARTLTLLTAGPPFGTAKAFVDFCLSTAGQALFQRAGYVVTNPATQ
jgi:phosphate transport system substrate-binding protein